MKISLPDILATNINPSGTRTIQTCTGEKIYKKKTNLICRKSVGSTIIQLNLHFNSYFHTRHKLLI